MSKFFTAFVAVALLAGAILTGAGGSKVGAQPVPSPTVSGMPLPSPSATATGM